MDDDFGKRDRLVDKLIAGTITDEERVALEEETNAKIARLRWLGNDFYLMTRWRRFTLWLFRREEWHTSGEDSQCFVTCCCGEELSASDNGLTWCPKCGTGYSTEFRCYRYPGWLRRKRG